MFWPLGGRRKHQQADKYAIRYNVLSEVVERHLGRIEVHLVRPPYSQTS